VPRDISQSDFTVPRHERTIAIWLLAICAMVFVMIVLGGLTRLTHSGLSMVEWRPLSGWLPPMGEAAWETTFHKYQAFPEFRELNKGMTLAGFKAIFWLEYVHRLWGRLIGIAFLVPAVVFAVRGWVKGSMIGKFVVMFVLGGLQGVLGWYMVKSGLADRPDVSQYRLTAHLGAALVIYAYMFWVALGLLFPRRAGEAMTGGSSRSGLGVAALIFVTILSGGFVAGLDAGLSYNTFPLMGGRLIPEGLFAMDPLWVNFFENITTVQFDHRLLAFVVVIAVAALWLANRRKALPRRARVALNHVVAVTVLQVALGITTLLLVVPVSVAALHQACAVALFTTALWTGYELRSGTGDAAEPAPADSR